MAKIILAKTAGFCWGVKRAIDITLDAGRRSGKTIYTFGPLIHNPQLIKLLEGKKIFSRDSIDGLKDDEVIIRTHGITPFKRTEIKESGNRIIDATCPLVAKVQGMIKKWSRKGYSVIIVGDDGHAEVVGLKGYASSPVHVISSMDGVGELPQYEKVFVAAQTTCDREKYASAVKAIKEKYPVVEVGDTICAATYERQDEVNELAGEVEALVVVGGKNSANTTRLAAIAREKGLDAFHIETEDELDLKKLSAYRNIGVTAGASTPRWLIERVLEKLEKLEEAGNYPFPLAVEGIRFLGKSNLLLALSGAGLTTINMEAMGLGINMKFAGLAFFAVLATYLFHQMSNAANLIISRPKKYQYHNLYKKTFWGMAGLSFLAGLALAVNIGAWQTLLYLALVLFGSTYGTEALRKLPGQLQLGKIPGSKDFSAAFAWGAITTIIPFFSLEGGKFFWVPFLFTFGVIYVRSVLIEMRDRYSDQVTGREVSAVALGQKKTTYLLLTLLGLVFLIAMSSFGLYGGTPFALMSVASLFLFWFVLTHKEKEWAPKNRFELALDGLFFFLSVPLFLFS